MWEEEYVRNCMRVEERIVCGSGGVGGCGSAISEPNNKLLYHCKIGDYFVTLQFSRDNS